MTNQGFTGTKADLVEQLTTEHREVEQLWSQLEVAHRNGDQLQAELAQRIVTMLSQHDAGELQFLYPAIADDVPEGGGLADHARDEHQEIRDLLNEVDGKDPADEDVYRTLERAVSTVGHHVQEEEGTLFVQLRQHLGQEQLAELGEKYQKAKPMLPTHPHPTTPDGKVGATVAGAVAGAADKVRDAVRGNG